MKKTLLLLLVVVLAASMVACSAPAAEGSASATPAEGSSSASAEASAPAEESQGSAETVTLNVAYMPNYASTWSLAVGINEGFFEEEGLNVVSYEFADGPTEISAMESGSIDLAYIGDGAHKLAVQGKADIFTISQISNAESVIGLKSAGVESLEALKGKRVGYSSGTSSENILKTALESVGLTMDDIEPYDMDASNMVMAMTSGSLDACATWSPNSFQILNEMDDAVQLCNNMTFVDSTVSLSSWIVSKDWAQKNRDTLLRFTRALYKAMDFGAQEANYDTVAGYVSDLLKLEKDVALQQVNDAEWLTGKECYEGAQDGKVENYYQTQQDGLLKSGVITEKVPVKDYVMFDVMTEAGEQLYGSAK